MYLIWGLTSFGSSHTIADRLKIQRFHIIAGQCEMSRDPLDRVLCLMQGPRSSSADALPTKVHIAIILLASPLFLLLYLVIRSVHSIYLLLLHGVLWISWGRRGINTLLIHSISVLWHDYIRDQIRPQLPRNTVILNFSDRRSWSNWSLPVITFRCLGAGHGLHPMIIVVRPFRRTRVFSFYKAFQEAKLGNSEKLKMMQFDLFSLMSTL
ncbi:MAG: hypothetical protein AB7O26_02375 [Planctomycetaceae bacterium]